MYTIASKIDFVNQLNQLNINKKNAQDYMEMYGFLRLNVSAIES